MNFLELTKNNAIKKEDKSIVFLPNWHDDLREDENSVVVIDTFDGISIEKAKSILLEITEEEEENNLEYQLDIELVSEMFNGFIISSEENIEEKMRSVLEVEGILDNESGDIVTENSMKLSELLSKLDNLPDGIYPIA